MVRLTEEGRAFRNAGAWAVGIFALAMVMLFLSTQIVLAQTPLLPGNYIAWNYTATGPDVLDHFEIRIDDLSWVDVGLVVDPVTSMFVAAPPLAGVFSVEVRPCRATGADDPPREVDGSDINCATSLSLPARFIITRDPTTLPPVDSNGITQTPYTPPIVDNSFPLIFGEPFVGYCVRESYTPDWMVGLVVNGSCQPLVFFQERNYGMLDTCSPNEMCPIPCGPDGCWRDDLWPEGPEFLNTVNG